MSTEIWRLLEPGETLQKGDEFFQRVWMPLHHAISELVNEAHVYRRRISAPDDGWISVKDRLPTKQDGDAGGFVLGLNEYSKTIVHIRQITPILCAYWRRLPPDPVRELSAKEKALQEWQGASKTSHEDIAWVAGWEACEKAMKA